MNDELWLLLIYTVPSTPSRKRAAVWRDLKRVGAVYLRDGVCAVPDRPLTRSAFTAIGDRIESYDGRATLIFSVQLPTDRAQELIDESTVARDAEYAEIARAARDFLEHVAGERDHRIFTEVEYVELEADFEKLNRWSEQVRSRDYWDAKGPELATLLQRCEQLLNRFLDETYQAVGEIHE